MPSTNTETYRECEKRWREEANRKPDGAERDACLGLADGYAHLILIIERIESDGRAPARKDGLRSCNADEVALMSQVAS